MKCKMGAILVGNGAPSVNLHRVGHLFQPRRAASLSPIDPHVDVALATVE